MGVAHERFVRESNKTFNWTKTFQSDFMARVMATSESRTNPYFECIVAYREFQATSVKRR